MAKFNVGEFHKFLSPKPEHYLIKEVIENADISVELDFPGGVCPDCKKQCTITRSFDISRIYVMESKSGEIAYKGETAEGELVRMPEQDFNFSKKSDFETKVKGKSLYLKEKPNGN